MQNRNSLVLYGKDNLFQEGIINSEAGSLNKKAASIA